MGSIVLKGKERQVDVSEPTPDNFNIDLSQNSYIEGTEGIGLPFGTKMGRPNQPEPAMIRGVFDKQSSIVDKIEYCDSTLNWHSLATEEFVLDAVSSIGVKEVRASSLSPNLTVIGSPINDTGEFVFDLSDTPSFDSISATTSTTAPFETISSALRLPKENIVETIYYNSGDIRNKLGNLQVCVSGALGSNAMWSDVQVKSRIIAGAEGGTGVNNSGKIISVEGNFLTKGAYPITLNSTGVTSVTLPQSGTLATTASVWDVAQGGTGMTSLPLSGGLLCGLGSNTISSVPSGNSGQLLISGGPGSLPTWTNTPNLTGIGAISTTDPFYISGSALTIPGSGGTTVSTMNYSRGDLRNNLGTIQVCTTAGLGSAAVWSNLSSTGTVTSVGITGSGITVTGSPITSSGSIGLSLSNVGTAGTYSWPSSITTNASGQVSSVSSAIAADILSLSALGALRLPSTALVSTNNYLSGDLRLNGTALSLCKTAGTGATAVWSQVPVTTGAYTCAFTTTGNTSLTLPTTGTLATTTSTWGVAQGGTGLTTSANTNAIVFTGTTSTGAYQNIANGAAGTVLVSGGVGLAPSWSTSLNLAGNVNIGGTLTALGAVTCSNNLGVGNNTTIGGTLGVLGAVTLGSTIGSTTAGGVVALTGNTARSVQIPTSTNATAPTVGEMRISAGAFYVCLTAGIWSKVTAV